MSFVTFSLDFTSTPDGAYIFDRSCTKAQVEAILHEDLIHGVQQCAPVARYLNNINPPHIIGSGSAGTAGSMENNSNFWLLLGLVRSQP